MYDPTRPSRPMPIGSFVVGKGTRTAISKAGDDAVDEAMAFKHISLMSKHSTLLREEGRHARWRDWDVLGAGLHAMLGSPDDETEVSLVYGSAISQYISRDTLHEWEAEHFWRFKVSHVRRCYWGGPYPEAPVT